MEGEDKKQQNLSFDTVVSNSVFLTGYRFLTMASTIGTMMMVVAVLEIHMLRNIVVSMNPSRSRRGC